MGIAIPIVAIVFGSLVIMVKLVLGFLSEKRSTVDQTMLDDLTKVMDKLENRVEVLESLIIQGKN